MGTVMFKLEQSLNLDLVCYVFKESVFLSLLPSKKFKTMSYLPSP